MKIKKLMDGDDETLWISSKWNNGEFDLYFVIRLRYLPAWMGEKEAPAKYGIDLLAVSPEAAGAENLRKAAEACGIEDTSALGEDAKVNLLTDYGVYAPLWDMTGSNARKLMQEARKQLQGASIMFGFYMDRQVNRIGDTGWDWIRGDIGANLKRLEPAQA